MYLVNAFIQSAHSIKSAYRFCMDIPLGFGPGTVADLMAHCAGVGNIFFSCLFPFAVVF